MVLAAGEVVAKKAGMSWDEFVRERLFTPLGMRRTTTTVRNLAALGNFATPHASFESPGGEHWVGQLGLDGAGGRHHLERQRHVALAAAATGRRDDRRAADLQRSGAAGDVGARTM